VNLKSVIKSILQPLLGSYNQWLHKNTVSFKYENIPVNILPGVYSPKKHFSTTMFLSYLSTVDVDGKTVLELGCGSGLISGYCASKGAMVTASDINDSALTELSVQARDNNWDVISVFSNLFENLHFHFDYILINPPIKSNPKSRKLDSGDFAGENFEYFDSLFQQLKVRTLRDTEVLIFLPEEAELFSICRRSKQHHLLLKTLKVVHQGLHSGTVYRIVNGN
jgi:release factor glutamine methyltransferase